MNMLAERLLPDIPTDEGRKRYPPDGHYKANELPGPACTCAQTCPNPCRGRFDKCGCVACDESFNDFGYEE